MGRKKDSLCGSPVLGTLYVNKTLCVVPEWMYSSYARSDAEILARLYSFWVPPEQQILSKISSLVGGGLSSQNLCLF